MTLAALLAVPAAPGLAQPVPTVPAADGQSSVTPTTPDFYAADGRLRDYVLDALGRNPSIQEAAARSRAATQRIPQVTSLPDPTLTIGQSIRTPETRVGSQLNTFTLTQATPGSASANCAATWPARKRRPRSRCTGRAVAR